VSQRPWRHALLPCCASVIRGGSSLVSSADRTAWTRWAKTVWVRCGMRGVSLAVFTFAVGLACGVGSVDSTPELQVAVQGSALLVTVHVDVPSGLSSSHVPFTAEPWNLSTPDLLALRESDVLGSGLVMDLDGDGATNSSLPMLCKTDGRLVISGQTWAALSRGGDGRMEYSPPALPQRLGENGVYLLYYSGCEVGKPFIGLSETPIELLSTPGPALNLTVLDVATGAADGGSLEIRDVVIDGEVVEPAVHHSAVGQVRSGAINWDHAYWIDLPVDAGPHDVQFILESDRRDQLKLIAATVWSDDGVERTRSGRAVADGL